MTAICRLPLPAITKRGRSVLRASYQVKKISFEHIFFWFLFYQTDYFDLTKNHYSSCCLAGFSFLTKTCRGQRSSQKCCFLFAILSSISLLGCNPLFFLVLIILSIVFTDVLSNPAYKQYSTCEVNQILSPICLYLDNDLSKVYLY